jgi:GNAT superfamily N-acetyltransferase
MPEIKIRNAEKADMTGVLALIQELADYERAPKEVIVTVEILNRDGFGENPLFKCLIAERENTMVGIALYYIKYSTWKGPCVFLEDIVVTLSERRIGIGKLLFEEVIKVANEMSAKRMEWQVLDWNEPAIKFYEKYQPEILKDWLNYRLTDKELATLKVNL